MYYKCEYCNGKSGKRIYVAGGKHLKYPTNVTLKLSGGKKK